ncbi:hypothetical protein KM792_05620 [Clostridium tyrobutyricum]|jgi:hypothetical protein|uniref:DUF6514 family protein n=1 Tax=Clostridium tyrobutyricum TaxID=1519 RepID=UPI000580474F|nr:DUF6514 family protein [Clostridium tyrobutyricum]MBR9647432.1 hypothetical protein [Clostridium tyrobutyricum]MBV4447092.1 hypothetical protein [Clostridium tyrobutyricum]MBV4449148.1 hypothetical protein [Clostridium tyrobutyricum]QCH27863.1 hypothetical protein EZN00_01461 [Clostridium tyrobutyricum]
MVIENLMRAKLVGNKKSNYFYRLIKNNLDIICRCDTVQIQSYGIEIERQDILNEKLVDICRDRVNNISPDRYKVHNLLKLLYTKEVSPIHLVDIIGDYVDDYVMDFDKQIKAMAY